MNRQSKPNKAYTIFDVARECGVSYATVSRVLNGHSDVKESTRERVLQVCKRLNYRPSAMAKGLTQKKSWLIGVVYHGGFDHPFFGRLLSSLKDSVEDHGYELVFFHGWSDDRVDDLVKRVNYRNIEGLIVAGAAQSSCAVNELKKLDVPMVTVNYRLAETVSAVISTQYKGAYQAMKRLWDWGHRDIGIITGDQQLSSGLYRYKAYTAFLKEKGLEVDPTYVLHSEFSERSEQITYDLVKECIRADHVPTAYFCSYDYMAIGAMKALSEHGFRIPQDISIIGYDDLEICRYVSPRLTTVRQDRTRMGMKAGEILLDLITNPLAVKKTVSVETELIIRESAGPVSRQKQSLNR